jgi:hypothetical protein
MIMALEITRNVYSDVCVCEVQGEGKVTVQMSIVGFGLECISNMVYGAPG